MKKLRNYFVMLTVAIMSLFCSSCGGGDDEEELGPFVEYANAEKFYNVYKSFTAGQKVLVDTRSAELYAAGHLSGAVNLPATVYNTSSDDAQWCKDLINKYPDKKNTCFFFYGPKTFQDAKIVAGRASRLGYGQENSRIYSKGYDDEMKKLFGVE